MLFRYLFSVYRPPRQYTSWLGKLEEDFFRSWTHGESVLRSVRRGGFSMGRVGGDVKRICIGGRSRGREWDCSLSYRPWAGCLLCLSPKQPH